MLRKFAAALLATALIAGPAFAQTGGNSTANPAAPAAQTTPNAPAGSTTAAKHAVTSVKSMKSAKSAKSAKSTRHIAKHARKRASWTGKTSAMHRARPMKSSKVHHAHAAKFGKPS